MRSTVFTSNAPAPIGPYSQAIWHNDTLYVSGQIAIDPITCEKIMGTVEEEAHLVIKNIGAILNEAGLTYRDVLKCTVFVTDMNLFSRINAVYETYFEKDFAPARELVEVTNLPKYGKLEISCIAGR
jgi:2-iminobutanoate/2-iminopropanoate deaminase